MITHVPVDDNQIATSSGASVCQGSKLTFFSTCKTLRAALLPTRKIKNRLANFAVCSLRKQSLSVSLGYF